MVTKYSGRTAATGAPRRRTPKRAHTENTEKTESSLRSLRYPHIPPKKGLKDIAHNDNEAR